MIVRHGAALAMATYRRPSFRGSRRRLQKGCIALSRLRIPIVILRIDPPAAARGAVSTAVVMSILCDGEQRRIRRMTGLEQIAVTVPVTKEAGAVLRGTNNIHARCTATRLR